MNKSTTLILILTLILALILTYWDLYGRPQMQEVSTQPLVVDSGTSTNEAVREYEDASEWRSPSIQFNGEGVEFLVIDEQGNRTGYDVNSKSEVEGFNEIYNSNYSGGIVPWGSNPPEKIARELFIAEGADQTYKLIVYGTTWSGEFNILIFGSGETLEISDRISRGQSIEYTINYDASTNEISYEKVK